MFSHGQIWSAIDALAQDNSISVSRLAKNAGLDPTTFNKSKRVSADGRDRWPSTESLSKIMRVTNTTVEKFMNLAADEQRGFSRDFGRIVSPGFSDAPQSSYSGPTSIPLLGLSKAGKDDLFDKAGLPTGEGWEAVNFPTIDKNSIYALEISDDSMMPLYRDGDRIIVSVGSAIRRGDRIVVRTRSGEVMAKELARQTATTVELNSINPELENCTIELKDIETMARIIWASQ